MFASGPPSIRQRKGQSVLCWTDGWRESPAQAPIDLRERELTGAVTAQISDQVGRLGRDLQLANSDPDQHRHHAGGPAIPAETEHETGGHVDREVADVDQRRDPESLTRGVA